MDAKYPEGTSSAKRFYLVESRVCPSTPEGFKNELRDDETFETDFIGASEQDCQSWALEQQSRVNFIEHDIIAIADARGARDGTLLMQWYAAELEPLPEDAGDPGPAFNFPKFGVLPKESNLWYDFRVDYTESVDVIVCLNYVSPDGVYPVYFGLKEELTDERGVFDVVRARRLVRGEDPDGLLE